ncbi:hypothetical protein PHLCEN_2v7271, partial [Hermanssonia centrifuga]
MGEMLVAESPGPFTVGTPTIKPKAPVFGLFITMSFNFVHSTWVRWRMRAGRSIVNELGTTKTQLAQLL